MENQDIKAKNYAWAQSGIVPVRKTDSDTAEMVTQILLGETMEILETRERWLRVRSDFDGYEGWVSVAQVTRFNSHLAYEQWVSHPERIRSPFFTYRLHRGKTWLTVPTGAPIVFNGFDAVLPDGPWDVDGSPVQLKEHAIMDTAMKFLGVPYLWGGRTDSGIDCSGFIQIVYALHRYSIPRDASQQFAFAKLSKKTIQEAGYGDIIYFHGKDGKSIVHVGFYLGEGNLLHASGNVQIQTIDPSRRDKSRYVFNDNLSKTIAGIQKSQALKAGALTGQRTPEAAEV